MEERRGAGWGGRRGAGFWPDRPSSYDLSWLAPKARIFFFWPNFSCAKGAVGRLYCLRQGTSKRD